MKLNTFSQLSLPKFLLSQIYKQGFHHPTPIQRKCIPLILNNQDIIGCSRTGSGKTMAYILPILGKLVQHQTIIGTRALIIAPTRELAKQIFSVAKLFAKKTDLIISLIIGGHQLEGQFEAIASNPDIIIATPGRLTQHLNDTSLTLQKVQYLVFDEADQLFELGFAPDLNIILERVSQNRQTLMFSATIPEELSSFAKAGLKDYSLVKLDKEYCLSENMALHFIISKSQEKCANIIWILKNLVKQNEATIIFVATRYHVEFLGSLFEKFHLKSSQIFGKMDQIARNDQYQRFKKKEVSILIVTDLAARGLDIPFVENIIHFDFPAKPKIFIHRSGRTARAGKSGTVYSIISTDEQMYISEILLYIGRKLSNQFEKTDGQGNFIPDNNYAYYGTIPLDEITYYQEEVLQLEIGDSEINKQLHTSENAYKLFKKSRANASNISVQRSRDFNFSQIHPLVRKHCKIDEQSSEKNLLERVSNYQPKESYLEIKKSKENLLEANQEFFRIINRFKEEKKAKEKQKEIAKSQKLAEENLLTNSAQQINEEKGVLDQKEGRLKNKKRMSKQLKKKLKQQKNEGVEDIVTKKVKKSQINDFRNNDQFIDYEPKQGTENSKKITDLDINAQIIGEDYEEMQKNKFKRIWDDSKKRFVKGRKNEVGKIITTNTNKKGKSDYGATKFNKWKKQNMIRFQQEGEEEDKTIIDRAKNLFQNRIKNKKFQTKPITKVKNELKSQGQIAKKIQDKFQKKFLNMKKGKKKFIQKNQRKGKK